MRPTCSPRCAWPRAPSPPRAAGRGMRRPGQGEGRVSCPFNAVPVETDTGLDANAGELFDRRQAGGHLGEAVVPERPHALADRGALDLLAAGVPHGQALELLRHGEQLVDADPALVARLVAARAALLAVED